MRRKLRGRESFYQISDSHHGTHAKLSTLSLDRLNELASHEIQSRTRNPSH